MTKEVKEEKEETVAVQDTVVETKSTVPAHHVVAKQEKGKMTMLFAASGIALLMGVGGIAIGMQIGKSSQSNTAMSSNGGSEGGPMMGGRGGGMMGRGGMGEVTAITDSSITVKSQFRDSETTYTIASSTTVTDEEGSVNTVSGIKVGDSVMVRTSGASSDTSDDASKTATAIVVNPQMPSGGAPGGAGASSSAESS